MVTSEFKAGNIPLIVDENGIMTVPEEYRRKPLQVDEDFIEYGQYWKAWRTPIDFVVYLTQRHIQKIPLMERFHI